MFQVLIRAASLSRTPLSRSLPAFSTTSRLNVIRDQLGRHEAPIIENDDALASPEQKQQRSVLESTITVPAKVDLTPVMGLPEVHVKTRRVRIYQQPRNCMQSGTNNIHHWEMEFDNRQRWENPLMGWTSSGDPLSNMKVAFRTPEEAIAHCEKNGWCWFVDVPRTEIPYGARNYGINFSWNRRTRVSTR